MRIVVDQDVCIGAASCVAIAAKTFGLNKEGKVYILHEAPEAEKGTWGDAVASVTAEGMDKRGMIIEAAQSCPVRAITLFEDDGNEIVL